MINDNDEAWKRINFEEIIDRAWCDSPQPFSLYRLDDEGEAIQCTFEEWAAFRHKHSKDLRFETGPVVTEFRGCGRHRLFATTVNGIPFAVHSGLTEAVQDHVLISRAAMTLH